MRRRRDRRRGGSPPAAALTRAAQRRNARTGDADAACAGRELLDELDASGSGGAARATNPTISPRSPALAPGGSPVPASGDLEDRCTARWLGRAAGCLLGKPVEKITREGIRAIAGSTGNWPLDAAISPRSASTRDVAAAYPWNRRSRATSLAENIDGMPEDDDLNYPLLALGLVERHGDAVTTDDVARAWLDRLPGRACVHRGTRRLPQPARRLRARRAAVAATRSASGSAR